MKKTRVVLRISIFLFQFLFFTFYFQLTVYAQEEQVKERLFIGDSVPNVRFEYMLNLPTMKGSLHDFKGKYLILDFWSKYCSNCIAAFPHLQELQEKFKDKIQILLVTNNTPAELESLFKKSLIIRNNKLPMILGDTILSKHLFPHMGEPYQVWLDKEFQVRATTWGEAATSDNFNDLINDKPLQNVGVRNDVLYDEMNGDVSLLDANKGMFIKYLQYFKAIQPRIDIQDSLRIKEKKISFEDFPKQSYYSLITTKLKGINRSGGGGLFDPTSQKLVGKRLFNVPILTLFIDAYSGEYSTKILLENTKQSYYYPKKNEERIAWELNNSFCYEVKLPNYSTDYANEIMKKDLHDFFGLTAKWEERLIPCLVLYRITNEDKLSSKGGEEIVDDTKTSRGFVFNNTSFSNFILHFWLDHYLIEKKYYLIDDTGIDRTKRVDMIITADNSDIPMLKDQLIKYGLGIKQEDRVVKVLVLRKD